MPVLPVLPELQRLLARGLGALPDMLVVDVGALMRWSYELDPGADVWPALLDASSRTHRRLAWIVAETAMPCVGVDQLRLNDVQKRLVDTFGAGAVLRSEEPAPALLAAVGGEWGSKPGVVSAGIDDRPYELWLLGAGPVAAMLDVASGRLWTRASVAEVYGDPTVLPRLYAILGPGADAALLVREARNYVEQLHEAAKSGLPFEGADVPARVKAALVQKTTAIDGLAAKLCGDARPDAAARAWLRTWLTEPGRLVTIGRADTAYVLAEVDRTVSPIALKRISIRIGDRMQVVHDHERGMALLRATTESDSRRWFMPHALDVLGCMADHGFPLPVVAVDPAYVAFVLDPDAPPSIADHCRSALSLSSPARRWLEDVRRELPFPSASRDWDNLVEILPSLDRSLTAALQQDGIEDLVEYDIGSTLPVLAKIERHGVWVDQPLGYASWDRVRNKLEKRLDFLQKIFMPLFGHLDPYRANFRELVDVLKRKYGLLPAVAWSPDLTAEDEFNRYVVLDAPEAVALDRARSIETSALYWQSSLQHAGGRLQGMQVPMVTGRWGFHNPPLHSLPKRSIEGRLLRSSLCAPPGYILLGCDYNAFEARLLASLSGDPVLMSAASAVDMHAEMARLLSTLGPVSRNDAKVGVYAIIYGQSLKGFRRRQATFTHPGSTSLYQRVEAALVGAFAYREKALDDFRKSKYVKTRGGWRRWAPNKRAAFNTLIQGLGADILRRVLRELDRQIAGLDAFIMHQAHDEVIIASRPECADAVGQILAVTMKNAAMQPPALLPRYVPLDVKIRRGTRWDEFL